PERRVCELQLGETELDGVEVRTALAEQDQRPEEVVPGALELEDRQRRDRGSGERQHHAPERLEVARAVELRRLLEVLGDGEEVLAHEEEVRGRDEVDQE